MADQYAACPDPGLCLPAEGDNVLLAFGLTFLAGAATLVGACVPFFSKLQNPKFLSGGLGLAAGVMIYVSFVEIFANKTFAYLCCVTEYYVAAGTAAFFGGMILTVALHVLVTWVQGFDSLSTKKSFLRVFRIKEKRSKLETTVVDARESFNQQMAGEGEFEEIAVAVPRNIYEYLNPSEDMSPAVSLTLNENSNAEFLKQRSETLVSQTADVSERVPDPRGSIETIEVSQPNEVGVAEGSNDENGAKVEKIKSEIDAGPTTEHNTITVDGSVDNSLLDLTADRERLTNMSIITAAAVSIHNFPEGLATFIAALSDGQLGAMMAISIALHNIPEGIVVAMPIYYATGSKWKGFFWAAMSGFSEVVGAFFGWLILKDTMGPTTFGVLFGMVAGMMVYIAFQELLPTALKYDPANSVASPSAFCGMLVIAISLVAFTFV
ncbi:hypothetical protein SARC_00657 [Sphaeroforma arctica JP610]|uniref:Uncharacterized protein n=1 Tax=Sphaeroforma arctica JP610 TaxID=667725 RepID=A0A0L0GDW8_9EUKA|nr:hypothetical protein SARC_00657 [Sphaeroforma arctica JP610]KNC87222.1 hypothetical protein SARC_00657 [Sphaeroforma arctica JP610]|eukprot:XP_014161124.1 hypothetical protein SARC_00657 [Sphaeroforma arctica JP610]